MIRRLATWARRLSWYYPALGMVLLALLLALPTSAGNGALAGSAHGPATQLVALGLLHPGDDRSPTVRTGSVFPPPPSVPAGVSICGPLFSNTALPTCQSGAVTVSMQQGGLHAYGLAILPANAQRFPNLQRDITLSQEAAGGLFMVLGHGKFNGLLGDTQLLTLDAIARGLHLSLQPGNVYRLEVDQKTGNLDFRDYLVGAATFTYVP